MEKKVHKKKKIRAIPVLILLLFLILSYFVISAYVQTDLENIIIVGNEKISDQEIIVMTELDSYPDFFFISTGKLEKTLLEIPIIKEVEVSKEFYHKLKIEVVEYNYLFINKITNKVVIANKEELDTNGMVMNVPSLLNYVPDEQYDRFVLEMDKLDSDIINKISEIQYLPNEYDPDRFLLYMSDGNSVYLTLTKFDVINKYEEMVVQLEGRKGILYLDSGNHFELFP